MFVESQVVESRVRRITGGRILFLLLFVFECVHSFSLNVYQPSQEFTQVLFAIRSSLRQGFVRGNRTMCGRNPPAPLRSPPASRARKPGHVPDRAFPHQARYVRSVRTRPAPGAPPYYNYPFPDSLLKEWQSNNSHR